MGWAVANRPAGRALAVGNLGDGTAANDLVFILAADGSVDLWDQARP